MGRKSREKRERRMARMNLKSPALRLASSVTLAEARAWADELVTWLDDERDLTLSSEPARSYMAAATFVRSFALFRSMLAQIDAGEPAAVGMVTRGLYEDWLTAAILIEGRSGDWIKLLADTELRERELAEAFDSPPQREPYDLEGQPAKKWSVRQRAKRVDELLRSSNAFDTYETMYALESTVSNHSGLSASGLHIAWDDATATAKLNHNPFPDEVIVPRVIFSGILLAYTASVVLEAGGYDVGPLRGLADRYSEDNFRR